MPTPYSVAPSALIPAPAHVPADGMRARPIVMPARAVQKLSDLELISRYGARPPTTTLDVAVVRIRLEPGGRIHPHAPGHPIVFCVLDGEGVMTVGTRGDFEVGPGDVVEWPARVEHAVETAGGLDAIAIELLGPAASDTGA